MNDKLKAKNEINKVLIKENKELLQIIHNVKNYVKHHRIDYINRNNILSILKGKEVEDNESN